MALRIGGTVVEGEDEHLRKPFPTPVSDEVYLNMSSSPAFSRQAQAHTPLSSAGYLPNIGGSSMGFHRKGVV